MKNDDSKDLSRYELTDDGKPKEIRELLDERQVTLPGHTKPSNTVRMERVTTPRTRRTDGCTLCGYYNGVHKAGCPNREKKTEPSAPRYRDAERIVRLLAATDEEDRLDDRQGMCILCGERPEEHDAGCPFRMADAFVEKYRSAVE